MALAKNQQPTAKQLDALRKRTVSTTQQEWLQQSKILHPDKEPFPTTGDGLKVVLSGYQNLTVDSNGRALLPQPFTFQCSPMESYAIAHTFNFGTYDTIDDDQFMRRGSRQLTTWTFDTLVMYLGASKDGHYQPGWVPYPTKESGGKQMQRPEWYIAQIRNLFVAGSPFRYAATFKDSTTIHLTCAVLTAFNEEYRHGEGDAIYLSGVAFSEWRDPRGSTPQQSAKLPAYVKFRVTSGRYMAFDVKNGKNVQTASKTSGTTFQDLARAYYGDASLWRTIAQANKCYGGSGSLPIFTRWFRDRQPGKTTITIPQKPKAK